MKLKGVLLLIGLAALLPAGASAHTSTMRGVVVGKQHGMLLVATPSGLVQAFRGHAAIGSRMQGSVVVGRANRARIHGIVVKQIGSMMILSSNRHLLAVHMGRRLADRAPNPNAVVPPAGTVVNTTVDVKDNGDLDEQNESEVGQVNGNIQVQATVTAVGNGTVTLSVNGQTVTVNLPAGLTLPASFVGQTVTINVSLGNNEDDNQGDDNDDNGNNSGHDGDGGGGDH
jgi:hypothetical protein